jgi:hypothetical protein
MAYRIIDENFWRSPVVRKLSDQGQLAYLYLFSVGGLSGIIHKSPEELAAGKGWPVTKWNQAVSELVEAGRVSIGYQGGMVWVKNHIDHQWLSSGRKLSPQIKKAIHREALQLPQCRLVFEAVERYPEVFEGYAGQKSADYQQTSENGAKPEPSVPQKPARTENQKLLDAEIEEARRVHRQVFGKDIKPAEIGLLVYGRNGGGKDCWGAVPILTAFWQACRGQKIENPFAWTQKCGQNPQTVARFEKQAFGAPGTSPGGEIEKLF